MDHTPSSGKVDKESLVTAIRSEIIACEDGKPLPMRKFLDARNFTYGDVRRHFARWSDAVRAAGYVPRLPGNQIRMEQLLADWAGSVRKLKQIPTSTEHDSLGNYHPSTIARACGNWNSLPGRFRKFAEGKEEWADVLPLLPPPGVRPAAFRPRVRTVERVYGDPLDYKNRAMPP